MMDAETFKAKTGDEPILDDLERVNCGSAGKPGHYQCGWCLKCDAPNWQCSHSVPK